jgi:hypothetical protein
MLDLPSRDNPRDGFIGLVQALAPIRKERNGQRGGEILGVGRRGPIGENAI